MELVFENDIRSEKYSFTFPIPRRGMEYKQ